jgi:hypothetical protein
MPTGYGAKIDPINNLETFALSINKSAQVCRLREIGDRISEIERDIFINNRKIKCASFKESSDGEFCPQKVCYDLRTASTVLLKGDYRFASALPYQLIERWYNMRTQKIFYDEKPMYDCYDISHPRGNFSHGNIENYCLDHSDKDLNTATNAWISLLNLLQVK